MPMLPIPAFVALVLGYLALRAALGGARPLLVAFLGACALQSALVTLVGGYGVEVLRPVLPVSATVIPPLAWITFRDALVDRMPARAMAIHAIAPAFTLFCRVFAPETTDFVIPLVFAGYGIAILIALRNTADMPLAKLDAARVPAALWQVLGWALIASAFSDVVIALAYATGNAEWTGWLITVSSSLVLLLIGMLSGSPSASGAQGDDVQSAPELPMQTSIEDAEIVSKLDVFLTRDPVHLDPNLTLARLARRLHLPEKRLSMAVNRATGDNVSRFINSWRIRHACVLIEAGANVTEAMLASGFNTKSNFNREFLRETGVAPSKWQANAQPALRGTTIGKLPSAKPVAALRQID